MGSLASLEQILSCTSKAAASMISYLVFREKLYIGMFVQTTL